MLEAKGSNGHSMSQGKKIGEWPKLASRKRAETIYKKPVELAEALTKAGLDIQKQKAEKNLGPVLGKRLKQLSAEHVGGDEEMRSARESKLADEKKKRADEDRERIEKLRAERALYNAAQVMGEIKVTDEDIIDAQETPLGQMKTSEKTPIISGEIISKDKLGRREYNKNVISRDLLNAARKNDEKARVSKIESERQRAKEIRIDEAEKAYVKAYREYDPRFTKNKDDELIIMTRPPFFSLFSSAAKELKRLYGVMVKARENMVSETEDQKIKENLAAEGEIKFKDSEAGLKPGDREALRWANEAEERAAEIKRVKTDAEVDRALNK